MKAEDLFIGAWVSVGEKPVEVKMVSQRKIGYHRDGDKTRLVYARLADVKPLRAEKVGLGLIEWLVNGWIKVKVNSAIINSVTNEIDGYWRVGNTFGESLLLGERIYVHELQRVLKIISRL